MPKCGCGAKRARSASPDEAASAIASSRAASRLAHTTPGRLQRPSGCRRSGASRRTVRSAAARSTSASGVRAGAVPARGQVSSVPRTNSTTDHSVSARCSRISHAVQRPSWGRAAHAAGATPRTTSRSRSREARRRCATSTRAPPATRDAGTGAALTKVVSTMSLAAYNMAPSHDGRRRTARRGRGARTRSDTASLRMVCPPDLDAHTTGRTSRRTSAPCQRPVTESPRPARARGAHAASAHHDSTPRRTPFASLRSWRPKLKWM